MKHLKNSSVKAINPTLVWSYRCNGMPALVSQAGVENSTTSGYVQCGTLLQIHSASRQAPPGGCDFYVARQPKKPATFPLPAKCSFAPLGTMQDSSSPQSSPGFARS